MVPRDAAGTTGAVNECLTQSHTIMLLSFAQIQRVFPQTTYVRDKSMIITLSICSLHSPYKHVRKKGREIYKAMENGTNDASNSN